MGKQTCAWRCAASANSAHTLNHSLRNFSFKFVATFILDICRHRLPSSKQYVLVHYLKLLNSYSTMQHVHRLRTSFSSVTPQRYVITCVSLLPHSPPPASQERGRKSSRTLQIFEICLTNL